VIGAAELARMRRGAVLVNTSRGPLVDESALIEAVRSGRVFAALDVYDREPLSADHPLVKCPNTVLTPHLGYSALEVYAEYYSHTVENALAFLDGKPLRVLERPTH
jgi:phosphoglycerate dehydrogenase-like enzyme